MNPIKANVMEEPSYQEGQQAARLGDSERSCPYGITQLMKRCLWKAGYHDETGSYDVMPVIAPALTPRYQNN